MNVWLLSEASSLHPYMPLSFTNSVSVDATYKGQEGNHISLTSVTFFRIEEEKKKKKQNKTT